jgi:hypothetical protein
MVAWQSPPLHGVPSDRIVQVPSLDAPRAAVHAVHEPVHGWSQHTPSATLPLAQPPADVDG